MSLMAMNSYTVKVIAEAGAAFKMLKDAPLYNPLMPSRLYIWPRHAGIDVTIDAGICSP